MIVKIGTVKDGQIVDTFWAHSGATLLVPMFHPKDLEQAEKAMKQHGPGSPIVMGPKDMMNRGKMTDVIAWATKDWDAFLASLPLNQNPTYRGGAPKENGAGVIELASGPLPKL